MSSYDQHKWTDIITCSPKDKSLVISGMADSMSPCVMEVEIIKNVWIKEELRSASCVLHLGGIFGLNYRILWVIVVMPQTTSTVCHSGYYCTYMSKDKILRFQKSKKRKATYTVVMMTTRSYTEVAGNSVFGIKRDHCIFCGNKCLPMNDRHP